MKSLDIRVSLYLPDEVYEKYVGLKQRKRLTGYLQTIIDQYEGGLSPLGIPASQSPDWVNQVQHMVTNQQYNTSTNANLSIETMLIKMAELESKLRNLQSEKSIQHNQMGSQLEQVENPMLESTDTHDSNFSGLSESVEQQPALSEYNSLQFSSSSVEDEELGEVYNHVESDISSIDELVEPIEHPEFSAKELIKQTVENRDKDENSAGVSLVSKLLKI